MASLPVLLNLLDELDHVPQSFYNNDFGLGLRPHHIQQQPMSVLAGLPVRSLLWGRGVPDGGRQMQCASGRKVSHIGKDGFQVCMEVGQFKPSELQVKVVDGAIVVEGKHEEREDDHGYISRHFVRRYSMPKGYDPNQIASTLSSDGVLTVSIPKPPALENTKNERVVQIQQVGPAHLNVKENGQEKISNGDNAEK